MNPNKLVLLIQIAALVVQVAVLMGLIRDAHTMKRIAREEAFKAIEDVFVLE